MRSTMGRDEMTEWIRAARYGDPWACDRVLGAHRPLVHALASLALDARPAVAAGTVAQDVLRRAHGTLHTLPSPEAFRPWLVALAVDTVLGHAAGTGGWLDAQDAVLAALGRLEDEGLLARYETAAALQWPAEETGARIGTARGRLDAARSVDTALARRPRCPALHGLTGGWDGLPTPGWRDHLAAHTTRCAACAGAPVGPAPFPAPSAAAEPVDPTRAYDLGDLAPLAAPAPAPAPGGRRGTRADRRRRRRVEERNRRRAAVAAGIAVVAVTGGAFSLYGGRDGQEGPEVNRAAAPGPDAPRGPDPDSLTTAPAPTGATPSARPSRATPSATPATTAAKTGTPRPTTATPTPRRTTASPTTTPAKKTAAPTTAPRPTRTTTAPTPGTDPDPGTGDQQDTGQGSAADQVIALVNAERAKAGCGPLTANATLTRAAQGHSDDMAARDFFDHTDPDGDGPGERVTAAGYPWSTYGENIAMGQTTPEQVMDAWMNSPGHRANILNCSFEEIGVGIHTDGGPYWTQVFGAR
ncbi:CAP domain-containing protein [Streptomyces sp. NPDC035033]|uniref:CAP domain-containing protein n=1 Tax=Streptomyces sp. NPDC035033 TaxID=3155368 RepID=UPI0033E0EDCE